METPFRDRHNRKVEITDLFRGRECFLVCAGPQSLSEIDLNLLNQRGILIASANNWPGVLPPNVRPHLWLFNDKPIKFHESIYHDPAILKFMPVTMANRQKRQWTVYTKKDGKFIPSRWYPIDMPCTILYERNHAFDPNTFLNSGSLCQGNDKQHALALDDKDRPIPNREPNGWPRVINTMFSAISLPYYLGVRTLYLVGVDFRMNWDKPYAFEQTKHRGGVIECNKHFRDMVIMFRGLKPKFDEAGYRVFNCYEHSGLADDKGLVFPYKPFEECVNESRSYAEFPASLDTAEWYDAEPVTS